MPGKLHLLQKPLLNTIYTRPFLQDLSLNYLNSFFSLYCTKPYRKRESKIILKSLEHSKEKGQCLFRRGIWKISLL